MERPSTYFLDPGERWWWNFRAVLNHGCLHAWAMIPLLLFENGSHLSELQNWIIIIRSWKLKKNEEEGRRDRTASLRDGGRLCIFCHCRHGRSSKSYLHGAHPAFGSTTLLKVSHKLWVTVAVHLVICVETLILFSLSVNQSSCKLNSHLMFHQLALADRSRRLHARPSVDASPKIRRNSIQLVMLKRSIFSWIKSGILISPIATAATKSITPASCRELSCQTSSLSLLVRETRRRETRWGGYVWFTFSVMDVLLEVSNWENMACLWSRCIASDLYL